MYNKIPVNRYNKTLKMLNKVCPSPSVIFDLGVRNPFSDIMEKNHYKVYNTSGQDFDTNPKVDIPGDVDLVTGFEIIEHLVSPYTLLKNINARIPIKVHSIPLAFLVQGCKWKSLYRK